MINDSILINNLILINELILVNDLMLINDLILINYSILINNFFLVSVCCFIGVRSEQQGVRGERSERWGCVASEASGGGVAERSEAPAGRPRK